MLESIIKNTKYIQFEFGRAWPDLSKYGIGEVIQQYQDSHDFFFIKDIVNKYIPTFIDIIAAKVQKDLNHSWGVRKKY